MDDRLKGRSERHNAPVVEGNAGLECRDGLIDEKQEQHYEAEEDEGGGERGI